MRGDSHRDIAAKLREWIEHDQMQPGQRLPKLDDLAEKYEVSRQTVREAVKLLAAAGWLRTTRGRVGGPEVCDRRVVRIALSRYSQVLAPGGAQGPWETACSEQGLEGRMVLVAFDQIRADDTLAEMFSVPRGTPLVYRRRHAMLGDSIHHLQQVWYPESLVAGTALGEGSKVEGGAFGLLAAVGYPPKELTEEVSTRLPTPEEVAELDTGSSVPILSVQRLVYDSAGRVLELLALTGPGNRMKLVYDRLPLDGGVRNVT